MRGTMYEIPKHAAGNALRCLIDLVDCSIDQSRKEIEPETFYGATTVNDNVFLKTNVFVYFL